MKIYQIERIATTKDCQIVDYIVGDPFEDYDNAKHAVGVLVEQLEVLPGKTETSESDTEVNRYSIVVEPVNSHYLSIQFNITEYNVIPKKKGVCHELRAGS